jgi:uncharacterized membrane protein YwaF
MFGAKHLIGLAFALIFYTLVYFLLKKLKKFNHNKMLWSFTIWFYLLEIAKIVHFIYRYGKYSPGILPFYFCSLPLYLYPLMIIFKDTKFSEKFIKPSAFTLIGAAGLITIAFPQTLLTNNPWLPLEPNITDIITLLFHGMMVFSSFWIIKSGFYKIKKYDFIYEIIVGLVFLSMAAVINEKFGTNFLWLKPGNSSPLNFIFEISSILYYIAHIGGFTLLIIIIHFLTYLLFKKKIINAKSAEN